MTASVRNRQLLWAAFLLVAFAVSGLSPVHASEPPHVVGVRAADHPGFGRLVFDLPNGAAVETAVEGDRVLLVFSGADTVGSAGTLPRNVVGASVDHLTATLSISPGTKPRVLRMGDRLVVDVLDRAPRAPAEATQNATEPTMVPAAERPPARPHSSGSVMARFAPVLDPDRSAEQPRPAPGTLPDAAPRGADALATPDLPTSPLATPGLPQPVGPVPLAFPVVPVERADLLQPAPPRVEQPGQASPPDGVASLRADPSVGAAAFRRGASAYVVLDRRLDLAAPPTLDAATVQVGPTTTLLSFPLAPDRSLRLGRTQSGWTIEIGFQKQPGVPEASIPVSGGSGGLSFRLARPGRAVTIVDPTTGGALLVGTSLLAGPATAVAAGQRRPGYAVLPTSLGVVVEPQSDLEDLQAGPQGFSLRPAAAPPMPVAEALPGRRFEFVDEPTPALLNRLSAQMASAAIAPPRARAAPRLAAAQTMLALGLDLEAQVLLQRAMNEDPQAASNAQIPALAAIAATLDGRPEEAGALDDARIQDSPDVDLWRGLRDRRLGRDTEPARNLPNRLAIARTYPPAIRGKIWPDLAEAAIDAGRELSPDETPPYAAALRLERAEKIDEALLAWQALAESNDRFESVRATRRLVELQLATGKIEPGAAAGVLERQALAWRGDDTELALRLRAAELRAASGQWREALDLLRATDSLFPDRQDEIRRRKTNAFETMLSKNGAGLSPLDVVLLAADYADCVPDDESGAKLAALLADKLSALDLPARAIPVLQGLMKAKAPGPARAQFGARLGAMMMDSGDPAGALTALDGSAAETLPAVLRDERVLIRARALDALGHPDQAITALQELDSSQAEDMRATLLAKAGDWSGCLTALAVLEARTIPDQGPLDAGMAAVILREAEAAQQVPDLARLQALRRWLPRMSGGPADVLRVLTSVPVTATAELPRARTELAQARLLPKHLDGTARP